MQSWDKSGEGITITRAASQEMMHLSLANRADHATPLYGAIYHDRTRRINRVASSLQTLGQADDACGVWISHDAATEQTIRLLCQQQSRGDNTLFLLLDLSIKGRMDLRAALFDQQTEQLKPITIAMVEG